VLFPPSCLATCFSGAPLSGHLCVFVCCTLFNCCNVLWNLSSFQGTSLYLLKSYRNLLVMKYSKNVLNTHKVWAEGLMEWRYIWIGTEFTDWSNVRHNLDNRLARHVVKFFAVQSIVNWAESFGTVVYTVRNYLEAQENVAKKRQLYHMTNFTLYNVLT
jgi:hypothetical protein